MYLRPRTIVLLLSVSLWVGCAVGPAGRVAGYLAWTGFQVYSVQRTATYKDVSLLKVYYVAHRWSAGSIPRKIVEGAASIQGRNLRC